MPMPKRTYNNKQQLTSIDGRIIPVRTSAYCLDTPYMMNIDPHLIYAAIDTYSWMLTWSGGGVEKDESLLGAAQDEDREENGMKRDPMLVSPIIMTWLEDMYHNIMPENPPAGPDYILRVGFRTKSTVMPVQQLPRPDEMYPEVIRPGYESIGVFDCEFRVMRPCFRHGIKTADKLGILHTIPGRREVQPDYASLARRWEKKMNIHETFIDFFSQPDPPSIKEALELYGEDIAKVFINLDLADKGLHDILKHRLPHHKKIREALKYSENTPSTSG